jgi:hypothetical protein
MMMHLLFATAVSLSYRIKPAYFFSSSTMASKIHCSKHHIPAIFCHLEATDHCLLETGKTSRKSIKNRAIGFFLYPHLLPNPDGKVLAASAVCNFTTLVFARICTSYQG